MRRIGVIMNTAADDVQSSLRLGWTVGRNVQIDTGWAPDEAATRRYAAELVALAPDVILTPAAPIVSALQQATRTVPIVFAGVINPVGAGLVESLARPGGNATGFTLFEYSIGGKWLELLKEIAPGVRRAAVLRDPATATGIGQLAAIHAMAPSVGMEIVPVGLRDAPEIERAVTAFAGSPNGGLILMASRTGDSFIAT